MSKYSDLVVLRDTREKEQNGWIFECEDKKPGRFRVTNTLEAGLDAGDYSVVGLEDKLVIERKNGFGELFGNYTPKDHQDRFENEMIRMIDVPHKYIIIETCLTNDALKLSVPQFKFAPPAKKVLSWLTNLQLKYGIDIIFAGDAGKQYARIIIEEVARKYLL